MQGFTVVYTVLLWASLMETANSTSCYQCTNIAYPEVCDTITLCGPHETCYVERYVSNAGVVSFDSGCKQFNKTCSGGIGKRSLYPDCSECCNGDFCNKNLCSTRQFKPVKRCLQCTGVVNPNDCTKVTACSDDQLCHTQQTEQFGVTLYTLGCLSKRECSMEPIFGRRKRTENCDQCCNSENCNRNLCVLKNATTFSTRNHIMTQTRQTTLPTTTVLHPKDCLEIYEKNVRQDGVYQISPDGITFINVFCDMTGGGWTLIQRRTNGDATFTRGWNDYENGFGNLYSDFWLGLDYIHILSNPPVEVMIEGITQDTNEAVWERFSNFTVDNAGSNFTLHVNKNGTYNNVAIQHLYTRNNGFGYHNGYPFSTFDHQNKYYCGDFDNGGWWYTNCWNVLINNNYDHMNMKANIHDGRIRKSKIKIRRSMPQA